MSLSHEDPEREITRNVSIILTFWRPLTISYRKLMIVLTADVSVSRLQIHISSNNVDQLLDVPNIPAETRPVFNAIIQTIDV